MMHIIDGTTARKFSTKYLLGMYRILVRRNDDRIITGYRIITRYSHTIIY
jgi:hypothetical protein